MFAAALIGGWVITTPILYGQPGFSVLFKRAFDTKRRIWASDEFKQQDPEAWALMQQGACWF